MMSFSRGDVVLVPFPFTDLTTKKQRPALVISGNRYNMTSPDVIVAAITSSKKRAESDISLTSWKEARLLFPSVVKVGKIVTIHKALIRKSLGHISSGGHGESGGNNWHQSWS